MNYDGKVVIGTEIDTSGFEDGIKDIEKTDVKGKFGKLKDIFGVIGNKLKSVVASILGISRAVVGLITKLGVIGVLIGGLVLIGKLIGDAFKIATQEDEELKAQIEYIRFALHNIAKIMAQSIGKVLKWLIDKVYDFLGIIGGVIYAISGKNIFEKSGIQEYSKHLKEANKGTKALNKSSKELQKTLTGFDEINKLNGGGAGVGLLGGSAEDISKYIEAGDDLAKKAKTWGQRIKEAFRIPTFQELVDNYISIWKAGFDALDYVFKIRETVKFFKETFSPIVKWAKDNVWMPMWNDMKETFSPYTKWLNDSIISPTKSYFGSLWDDLLEIFAPYINVFIDWINNTFGIFGINIKRIETKSEKMAKEMREDLGTIDKKVDATGKNIDTDINDNLETAHLKACKLSRENYEVTIENSSIVNTNSKLSGLIDYLKQLTSKTWKIATNFTANGGKTLKDWYNDTLRTQFKNIGLTLPKLARGGIVNLPGRGVPIGGAIAGERGQEGVIPLTDAQQMELIGQAIGRYATINLTNITKLNARQINKEMRKVSAESDFATNG